MILDRDTTEPTLLISVANSDRELEAGISFSHAALSVYVTLAGGASREMLDLVAGTPGQYIPNSWGEVADGLYQLCLSPSHVVPGKFTVVDVRFEDNPLQRDHIEWSGSPSLSVSQANQLADTFKLNGLYVFTNVETGVDSIVRLSDVPPPVIP